MKTLKHFLIIGLLFLLSSCIFPNHKDDIKFVFPPDIAPMCNLALNTSRDAIQSKGTTLKLQRIGCTVIKKPGERKFGSMWAFYSKEWNSYVGGLCWGDRIEIGCNPVTGSEILFDVLKHEFGHYWLFSNFGNMTHMNLYSDVFMNWRDISSKTFIITSTDNISIKSVAENAKKTMKEGDWFSVEGIDKNGNQYHIDFVVDE